MGGRSLNREQSNANAEGSAIAFLGDHQVKKSICTHSTHHELDLIMTVTP